MGYEGVEWEEKMVKQRKTEEKGEWGRNREGGARRRRGDSGMMKFKNDNEPDEITTYHHHQH